MRCYNFTCLVLGQSQTGCVHMMHFIWRLSRSTALCWKAVQTLSRDSNLRLHGPKSPKPVLPPVPHSSFTPPGWVPRVANIASNDNTFFHSPLSLFSLKFLNALPTVIPSKLTDKRSHALFLYTTYKSNYLLCLDLVTERTRIQWEKQRMEEIFSGRVFLGG